MNAEMPHTDFFANCDMNEKAKAVEFTGAIQR